MTEVPYDYTQEDHAREVERALMYIAQAQRKCEEIAASLAKDGAEERFVTGLWTSATALRAEHNRLLNTSHFPVPEEAEEGQGGEAAGTLLDAGPATQDATPHDQQRMAL